MSRAQLTSTVEQNTGGAVAPFLAGKNKIINGDFGIWQRGTSFSNPVGVYTSDRWLIEYDASGSTTKSVTQRTFTPGTAPVTGYEGTYYAEFACTVAGSGGTYNLFEQRIEDVRVFANQTITYSFWAKAAANTTIPSVQIRQNFGSGGSASVDTTINSSLAVTTAWQRFTGTVTVPSVSGQTIGTGSYLRFAIFCPINATYTLNFWGVQLEAGSVATPFTTATGTLSGELAACQRYYWRNTAPSSSTQMTPYGSCFSTTVMRTYVPFPVTMRTSPSAVEYSGLQTYDLSAFQTINTLDFNNANTAGALISGNVTSGLTQFRPANIYANASTSYIGFSAEL